MNHPQVGIELKHILLPKYRKGLDTSYYNINKSLSQHIFLNL